MPTVNTGERRQEQVEEALLSLICFISAGGRRTDLQQFGFMLDSIQKEELIIYEMHELIKIPAALTSQ